MAWMIFPAWTFAVNCGVTAAINATAPPLWPPSTMTPWNCDFTASTTIWSVSPSASPRWATISGVPFTVSARPSSVPARPAASRCAAALSDFSSSLVCANRPSSFFSSSPSGLFSLPASKRINASSPRALS